MNNNISVSLTATAAYGFGGKQYVARIKGRSDKFTFSRDFAGRKSGKRLDCTSLDTDEPGLYLTCDIDRRGDKDETFWVVYECPGLGMAKWDVDRDEMMVLAKRLDAGTVDWTRAALESRLARSEAKAQEADVDLAEGQLGLPVGKVRRSILVEALRDALDAGDIQRPGNGGGRRKSEAMADAHDDWKERALVAEQRLATITTLVSIYDNQDEPEGQVSARRALTAIGETIGQQCSICRSRHGSEVQHHAE